MKNQKELPGPQNVSILLRSYKEGYDQIELICALCKKRIEKNEPLLLEATINQKGNFKEFLITKNCHKDCFLKKKGECDG